MPVAPRYVAPGIGSVAAGIGRGVLAGLQQGSAMADADVNRRIALEQLAAQKRREERGIADWLAQGQVPQPFGNGVAGGPGRASGDSGGPMVGGVGVQDIAVSEGEIAKYDATDAAYMRATGRPRRDAMVTVGENPLVRRLGWSPENAPEPDRLALELRRRANAGEVSASQVPGILDEYANWYARASREAGRRTGVLVQLAEQKAAEQGQMVRDQNARAIANENRRRITAQIRSGALPGNALPSDDALLTDAYAYLDGAGKALGDDLVGSTTELGKSMVGERGELARVAEDRRQASVKERNRQVVEDARADTEFRRIVGGPEFGSMVAAAMAGGMSQQAAEESAVEEARIRAQDRARSVEGVETAVRDITGSLEPQQAPAASRFTVAPGGSDIQTILYGDEAGVGAAFDRAYAVDPRAAMKALEERGKTARAALVDAGALPPPPGAAQPAGGAPFKATGGAPAGAIILRAQPDGSWVREDGRIVSRNVGAAMIERGLAVPGQ